MMILQKSVLNLFKLLFICKTTFVFCYTNYNAKNNFFRKTAVEYYCGQ